MLTDWRSTINLRNCCTYAQNIIIMLMSFDSYWPFHYHHRRIDSIASPPSKNIYFHVCLWPFKNKSDKPDFSDFVCLFQFDGALAQPTSSSSLPSPIQPALNAYICNFLNLIIFLFFARASERAFWQMKCLLPSRSSSSSYILCVHNFKFPSKILYILKIKLFIISTTLLTCVCAWHRVCLREKCSERIQGFLILKSEWVSAGERYIEKCEMYYSKIIIWIL